MYFRVLPSVELPPLQNFVISVKLKLFTFIGGTTMSNDSSPLARTEVPKAATFCNMSTRL